MWLENLEVRVKKYPIKKPSHYTRVLLPNLTIIMKPSQIYKKN